MARRGAARGACDELAALDSLNTGMPLSQAQRNIAAAVEFFRYFSGWCTKINGIAHDVRMSGGLSGVDAVDPRVHDQGAGRCRRADRPVERSRVQRRRQARPVAGRRLQQRAQAGRGDAAVGTGLRAGAGRGRRSRGCRQSGQRLWAHRRPSMIEHPDVDKIAFTGSTEVGKKIVQAAAGNLKRVMLELGGKSPVLIYDDADLDKAIPSASMGIFIHSGQACVAGSRVFVQRGVYDQVVEGIAALAGKIRLGGPNEERVHSGPLISERQLHRVMGYIDEGKSDGAEVVVGGHRLDRTGYFVHPTVLARSGGHAVCPEEIFGPVVAITPFDDDDEVVAMANDTTYGLAAAAWTRDVSHAHRLAKRLDAGTVSLNCQMMWDPAMPFGGYKQSGWGYENGQDGIEGYLKTKTVRAQL